MKLREQIPRPLRESALVLPGFGDGEGAWSGAEAVAVIDSLRGSIIAVSEIALFERAPWGYVPSETAMAIDRRPNEGDADYAMRSRVSAARFIRGCTPDSDDALFSLTFPIWKDAE